MKHLLFSIQSVLRMMEMNFGMNLKSTDKCSTLAMINLSKDVCIHKGQMSLVEFTPNIEM